MDYSVILVQRGISAATHPVSGKSGKLYGNSHVSPEHGGVIFPISSEEYAANAHDLVGNTAPGQQWVPEFIPTLKAASGGAKCDRCHRLAVAKWDRYSFCETHAPVNAVYLDGSGQTVGERRDGAAPRAVAAAPKPVVEERLTGEVEGEERQLPQETMAAPVIGTDEENAPSPVIRAPFRAPLPAPAFHEGTSTPPPAPKTNAVEVITSAVVDKVMEQLPGAIEKILANRQLEGSKPKPARPARRQRPQSEFTDLQQRAKELGINSFGKNTEALRAAIAKKEGPAAQKEPKAPEEEDIPF